jgi:hypothetical protein
MTYDEAVLKAKTDNYASFTDLNTAADTIATQAETIAAGDYSNVGRQQIQDAVQYLQSVKRFTIQASINQRPLLPTSEAATMAGLISASNTAAIQARSCLQRAQVAAQTYQGKA